MKFQIEVEWNGIISPPIQIAANITDALERNLPCSVISCKYERSDHHKESFNPNETTRIDKPA